LMTRGMSKEESLPLDRAHDASQARRREEAIRGEYPLDTPEEVQRKMAFGNRLSDIKHSKVSDDFHRFEAVDEKGGPLGTLYVHETPYGLVPGSINMTPAQRYFGTSTKLYEAAKEKLGKRFLNIPRTGKDADAAVEAAREHGYTQSDKGQGFRNSQGMKHVMAPRENFEAWIKDRAAHVEKLRSEMKNYDIEGNVEKSFPSEDVPWKTEQEQVGASTNKAFEDAFKNETPEVKAAALKAYIKRKRGQ